MPLMIGTLPTQLAGPVKNYEKQILEALLKCRDALAGGTAGTACRRWFGDDSAPFQKTMKENIAKMRSVLNSQSIECKTDSVVLRGTVVKNPNENAEALHFTGGIYGGGARVDKMTSSQTYIKIGPNFKNLPATAAGIPGSWTGQDQFETIVHELSHFVHGTLDANLDDGTTAYEGQNARLLVTQSAARAKTNAENWGFFVEEYL